MQQTFSVVEAQDLKVGDMLEHTTETVVDLWWDHLGYQVTTDMDAYDVPANHPFRVLNS